MRLVAWAAVSMEATPSYFTVMATGQLESCEVGGYLQLAEYRIRSVIGVGSSNICSMWLVQLCCHAVASMHGGASPASHTHAP